MKSRFCNFVLVILLLPGVDAWSASLAAPTPTGSPANDGLAASTQFVNGPSLRLASLMQPVPQAAPPSDDWQKRWEKAAHKKNTGWVLATVGVGVMVFGLFAPSTVFKNDPAAECAGRVDYIACQMDESYNTEGLLKGLGVVLVGGVVEAAGLKMVTAGRREMNALQRERQAGASQTSLTIPLWKTRGLATELRARVGSESGLAVACSW